MKGNVAGIRIRNLAENWNLPSIMEAHGLSQSKRVCLGQFVPIEGTMQTVLEPVDLEFATPPGRVKLLSIIP